MKQTLFGALFAALFLALSGFTPPTGRDCDLSDVQKGFYCERHEFLTAGDLVSGAPYFYCEACDEAQAAAGKCEFCEEDLVRKTSGKNVCPRCFTKPEEVEVCVKSCFECPECGERAAKAGKCADCEEALVNVKVKARVEYECPACETWSEKPRKCGDKECKAFGKPFRKLCSESGSFPHGS